MLTLSVAIMLSKAEQGVSQNLPDSRNNSEYTYVYQITDKQAKQIYKKGITRVEADYFHTRVDSFPTGEEYGRRLPSGHYLQTWVQENRQFFSMATVQPFDVFVLNDQVNLAVRITDRTGEPLSDATVRIKGKRLRYDRESRTFVDRKSNKQGVLQVTREGFTAYYRLDREYNNSAFRRGARTLLTQTPLKLVWLPLRYVALLPVDGVRSVVHSRPVGTIYKTKRFFQQSGETLSGDRGYVVFSQPKYRPGDTVRIKAFLVNKRGKPLEEPLELALRKPRNRDAIRLATITPYSPGAYTWQFVIHDSLNLKLDDFYTVLFRYKQQVLPVWGSFRYEDYELSSLTMELMSDMEHYRGVPFVLRISGKDENELRIRDGRLEVRLCSQQVQQYLADHLFVPDTLYYKELPLDPSGETTLEIPDSIFPPANLTYRLEVRLLNSDNEQSTENRTVTYYHRVERFDFVLERDTLEIRLMKNGQSVSRAGVVQGVDCFGYPTELFRGEFPCRIPVEPGVRSYKAIAGELEQHKVMDREDPQIRCISSRTRDSLRIVVDNPRNLPFNYSLYRQDALQEQGYADSLRMRVASDAGKTYFLTLRYLWGGKERSETYSLPFRTEQLTLSVTQPETIYPGQLVTTEVRVTDANGEPVEGVDVTAWALTRKFATDLPIIPSLGKPLRGKKAINRFTLREGVSPSQASLPLDYNTWRALASLDTIPLYQFLYPGQSLYRYEYQAGDTATQFAPYVLSQGEVVPVHVVYVDNRPVYLSWASGRPYSFRICPGVHQVTLRTARETIVFDSLLFRSGVKTILAVDREQIRSSNVRISPAAEELSYGEVETLQRYLLVYRNTFGSNMAWLRSGEEWLVLHTPYAYAQGYPIRRPVQRRNGYLWTGPLTDLTDSATLFINDRPDVSFLVEPEYAYEFAGPKIKMRSLDKPANPGRLAQHGGYWSLTDRALTDTVLRQMWRDHLDTYRRTRARYNNPRRTEKGRGSLQIAPTIATFAQRPLNTLLFSLEDPDFLRVYPGEVNRFHNLQEGYYRLCFFFPGSAYQQHDSVRVVCDGHTFLRYDPSLELKRDTFGWQLDRFIDQVVFQDAGSGSVRQEELNAIYRIAAETAGFGERRYVEGRVVDREGLPIPGANVTVKGSSVSTSTDAEGRYRIYLPVLQPELVFSFIGMVPVTEKVGNRSLIHVTLQEGQSAIGEVVVAGYFSHPHVSYTGSAITLDAESLRNMATRNLIQELSALDPSFLVEEDGSYGSDPNALPDILIRGAAVLEAKPPVIVVDGQVFTGTLEQLQQQFSGRISGMQVLKDAATTALYGARAANGVIIITTGAVPDNGQAEEVEEIVWPEEMAGSSSIRENFSDVAYWQPALTTDKEGKVVFETVFPDDITRWDAFFLAMNGNRQSGSIARSVKSYKPLAARLSVPRFLIASDSTALIGKVVNHSPLPMEVSTYFSLAGTEQQVASKQVEHSAIDTLPLRATGDTLRVAYRMQHESGYFDGEQWEIPVFPVGLEEAYGTFTVLDRDTTVALSFDREKGPVTLHARALALDLLEEEIRHVVAYRYLCNEQLASKLKMQLALRRIDRLRGRESRNDKEIRDLIKQLNQNRHARGVWGWWKGSGESWWISRHVLEAMVEAEAAGFKVEIDRQQLTDRLVWELTQNGDVLNRVGLLQLARKLNITLDYAHYLSLLKRDISNRERAGLPHAGLLFMQLAELRQQCGMTYSLDSLRAYRRESRTGNVYYTDSDKKPGVRHVFDNPVQTTLAAYRLLRLQPEQNRRELQKIRNWLLEVRENGFWRNTYESAQVVEHILPDLLEGKSDVQQPLLRIEGSVEREITRFPVTLELSPSDSVRVVKTGDLPVYLTTYQHYWNTTPERKQEDFRITTAFESGCDLLEQGKDAVLLVEVELDEDADYVMVCVPIPGGCSYLSKEKSNYNETHRESYKHETVIFCEKLRRGKHVFKIRLMPRYGGRYTLNPARIELMYFPVFQANETMREVRVE